MGARKPYHRTAQRVAQGHSGAASVEDAVRRLGLRCGLVQPGQRAQVVRDVDGVRWLLTCGGTTWRVDMALQDYEDAAHPTLVPLQA